MALCHRLQKFGCSVARRANGSCNKQICHSHPGNGGLVRRITPSFKAAFRTVHTPRPLCSKDSDVSRYPVPPRESLPEDVKNLMAETEEKGGFLPNVFKALSYRPDEFRAFFNYYDVLMATDRGNLTKADKELIVVATSAENNCLYCVIAHGALLRIYSKNPILADQVAANWRTADLDPRQRAILEFAMDVMHCEPLSEGKVKVLEEHGLDRDDAWDIGAITALFALSNRMAFLTNMKPNEEFYLLGRVPRGKKT